MFSQKKVLARLASAVLLLAVVATAPAFAGEDEPLPPIASLEQDLLGLQKNLTSLSFRIRHGMSGIGGPSDDSIPPTPGVACCASNLERIDMKMRKMMKTLERLDLYYAARNDSEALAVLDRVRVEMNIVARGMAAFAMSETTGRAIDAQLGVIRPFNRLRDAIAALKNCCPVEGRLPETSGGG